MSEPDAAPPAAPTPTTCYRHTDRETGRRCTRCGRPACWECLRDAPVGAHCAECVKAEQLPASEQMRRQMRGVLGDPLLVTKTIIGLNLAMFVLQLMHGSSFGTFLGGGGGIPTAFERRWGLFPEGVAAGQWDRLYTSGFIHFGFMHILFNMLILYRLGQDLEAGIGRWRYALLYTASLVAGSFAVVLLNDRGVNGGASGAVFGLAAAATIALFQRGVRFSATGWGPLLLINLVITFVVPHISIGAHLGGAVAGAVLGAVMLHPSHGVRYKTAGYLLAIAMIIGCTVGAIAWSRHLYPQCVNSTGDLHAVCTGQILGG